VSFVSFVLSVAASAPAYAALGGDTTSIDADRVRMQAAFIRMVRADRYTLHEVQSPTGTMIRQYVGPSGRVFAVAWSGQFAPDLRQILGSYFAVYQQEVQRQRRARRARGPVTIDTGDFVVQVSGHSRFVSGRAYATRLAPSGIDPAAFR
jgi:hypothetical protein